MTSFDSGPLCVGSIEFASNNLNQLSFDVLGDLTILNTSTNNSIMQVMNNLVSLSPSGPYIVGNAYNMTAVFEQSLTSIPTVNPPNTSDIISNVSISGTSLTFSWTPGTGSGTQFKFSLANPNLVVSSSLGITLTFGLESVVATTTPLAGTSSSFTATFSGNITSSASLITITATNATISGTPTISNNTFTFTATPIMYGYMTFTFGGINGLSTTFGPSQPIYAVGTIVKSNPHITGVNKVAYFPGNVNKLLSSIILQSPCSVSGEWTYQVWIRSLLSTTGYYAIFGTNSWGGNIANCQGIMISSNCDGVYLDMGVPGASYVESDNNWHQITIVNDNINNQQLLYKDGALNNTLQTCCLAPINFWYIGTAPCLSGINMYLSNMRLWNVALSASQISANYNKIYYTAPNLVYNFVLDGSATETVSNIQSTVYGVTFVTP